MSLPIWQFGIGKPVKESEKSYGGQVGLLLAPPQIQQLRIRTKEDTSMELSQSKR